MRFAIGKSLVHFTLLIVFTTPITKAEDDPLNSESAITTGDRDHWSFKPIVRPATPEVIDRQWPRTAIDRFILARLEDKALSPADEAARIVLIRRLHFDVIGLPPRPAEVDRFVRDPSCDAYEQLVDRLLASPHYGERWGQHWLDLARFAETDGFEHDKVRSAAWKYRDWVIRSLNADMPYDQFVRWQIAGDVLEPHVEEARVATAFCLSGPDMPDINSQTERKHTLLSEITSTVGSVFLGLQFGCARCHDHMYDPISQADFYRMRAFFQPAVQVKPNEPISVLATTSVADPSHVLIRGDWRRLGPMVQPAFPRIANPEHQAVTSENGNERRAEFADWLTRRGNPLTTRVIVNRIWQFHFGRGLSDSPSDFGVMGNEPSHPQLLDWLATELVRQNWSLKELHRLILYSSVYRQRSTAPSASPELERWKQSLASDPDNQLLSRFPRRRLEAEIVRDAMFAVSDSLVSEMGGPGVRPPLPRELISTLLKNQWDPSERVSDHRRRSIYIFARRNLRYPMFAAFDRPAANSSCAERQVSTTAPQSLLLMNSSLSLDAAELLASRIRERVGDDCLRQIEMAVRQVFGRPATDTELQEMDQFLKQQLALADKEPSAIIQQLALTDLCLALLNSSEFLFVD